MSGGVEVIKQDASELVKQIVQDYSIDEKTAEKLISFFNTLSLEKIEKWRNNFLKRQREKADEIYKLLKEFKSNEKKDVLEKIENKILELYVEK